MSADSVAIMVYYSISATAFYIGSIPKYQHVENLERLCRVCSKTFYISGRHDGHIWTGKEIKYLLLDLAKHIAFEDYQRRILTVDICYFVCKGIEMYLKYDRYITDSVVFRDIFHESIEAIETCIQTQDPAFQEYCWNIIIRRFIAG